jgi:hypothetical protein
MQTHESQEILIPHPAVSPSRGKERHFALLDPVNGGWGRHIAQARDIMGSESFLFGFIFHKTDSSKV